jgi:hypothetical protein
MLQQANVARFARPPGTQEKNAALRWIFFLPFAIRPLRPQGQQKIVIVTLLRTEWRRT